MSSCPQVVEGCPEGHVSYDIGTHPSYVAIASSSVSCLGSLLIILVYCLFKDLRSTAQKIITFLAIADLISALGYIAGSINFIVHFNGTDEHECKVFNDLCVAQASVTSWSSLASFSWTLTLAFYFYLVIVYARRTFASKLMMMIIYHILAWVIPMFIIIPLAATSKLGYAPYAASNWCFVKSPHTKALRELKEIGFVLLAGKFWEISTYIISIYVYIHIVGVLVRRRKYYQPLPRINEVERVEKRLLCIPAFFLILRIWGTIQFFYSIAVYTSNKNGCILAQHHTVFLILGYLQAIGDPGQGWGNAVVYVFLSPTVRRKLFSPLCRSCLKTLGDWFISMANSTHEEQQQHVQQHQRQQRSPESGSGTPQPQLPHIVPRTASVTVSSHDITEVECGPTPGSEMDPSPP